MSDIDLDGALEALSEDLPDEVEPIVDSGETMVEDNPAVEAESFTGFDPNTLPEDMQAVYRSMQADYTRKTQELAEQRKSFEAFAEQGVDPNDALEAVSLWQKMDNDPQFAQAVAENIQNRLEELGYSSQQIEEATSDVNESYDGLPPQLQQELQEMRAWREEMIAEQQQQALVQEIEATEQMIRTTNPQYGEEDIEAIYNLAYAHDGDLMAAQEAYHKIQQRLLGSYLESKTVPHGATPAPNAPGSVPPKSFTNLDEAHKAAMEAVRNIS